MKLLMDGLILSTGSAPDIMKRWQKLDPDHDIPDLAGYNIAGTVRYIDRDAFRALIDPEYAKHILGEAIDTGLTPEQTIQCLIEHEGDEKVILDSSSCRRDWPFQDAAHDGA